MTHRYARKLLEGGRMIEAIPLTFGRARIGVGPVDASAYDDVW